MRDHSLAPLLIIVSSIALYWQGVAPTAAQIKSKTGATITGSGPGMVSTSEEAKPASYNAKALHRLDFRVAGSSCAKCLLQIQQQAGTIPGTIKAAVQLQTPYAGVVVYDSSKTGKEKIFADAKKGFPTVKFTNVEDKPISGMPPVLIPKIGE